MEIKSQNVSTNDDTDAFLRSISEKQDRRKIFKKRKGACCEEAEGSEEEEGKFRTLFLLISCQLHWQYAFSMQCFNFFDIILPSYSILAL